MSKRTLKEVIPSSTGSETGSYHWFSTILARHLHMGEYLKKYGEAPSPLVLMAWAEDLYNTSQELITWFHNHEIDKVLKKEKKKEKYVNISKIESHEITNNFIEFEKKYQEALLSNNNEFDRFIERLKATLKDIELKK